MYLYSSHTPYSPFTNQFEREIELRCELKKKLLWLKNYAQPDDKAEQDELKPVHKLPIANTSKEKEKFDESIDSLLGRLLQKEAQGGATVFGIQERETLTSDIIDYRKRKQQEVIADLEKRFGLSDVELREIVEKRIDAALENDPPPPSAGVNAVFEIKKFLVDEILGLGPLEDFMRDDDVDEIMVNGPDKIFIEKHGRLQLTVRQFANEQHVRTVIERILRPVGRTVNEKTPYVDARLLDGSRVHAIIPPLSLSGPMITIRKFSRVPYTMDDLVFRFKSATSEVAEFLKLCVHMKKNIVVSGGASSGKTTLLNVLSNFIYPTERVICIEDSAELRLNQVNLGRLESRQQGTEAKNQVTIRDLVRNALRMRPDRIIIGECRGGEAIDMLQAMNTGHDGSLTTLHANTPRDAVARLETMVLMGGVDLPLRAIREQIASSVNIIVQNGRLADGKRRI
ncbi:MAG: Flp pilus assembly complex ATPase component TadA, partial [Candidatus Riflebacteria bacterium]|nr:Flp pilus assembly complex ATPase component TadA [Candidatus Riflebacteria bacterium]